MQIKYKKNSMNNMIKYYNKSNNMTETELLMDTIIKNNN